MKSQNTNRRIIKLAVIFLLLFNSCDATVHNVPSQFSGIQSALQACSTGDTVLVQPGLYQDTIVWPNTADIKLVSAGNAYNTFIDAMHLASVIRIDLNLLPATASATIKGFTLTNGYADNGGGLNLTYGNYILEDLIISNNHSERFGGGIGAGGDFSNHSRISLKDVQLINNDCITNGNLSFGGGVYMSSMDAIFENCSIIDNSCLGTSSIKGAGCFFTSSNVTFDKSQISNNKILTNTAPFLNGGGIYTEASDTLVLRNCLVSNNEIQSASLTSYGSAIAIKDFVHFISIKNLTFADNHSQSMVWNSIVSDVQTTHAHDWTITNSIVWSQIALSEIGGTHSYFTVSYSNIKGGFTGANNIQSDPQFVGNGNYHLNYYSPSVNTGISDTSISNDLENNSRPLPAGTFPDMGSYEIDQDFVSVQDLSSDDNVQIYPVPFKNEIKIQIKENRNQRSEINIYSADGRIVFYKSYSTGIESECLTIDMNSYQSGLYRIVIYSDLNVICNKSIVKL